MQHITFMKVGFSWLKALPEVSKTTPVSHLHQQFQPLFLARVDHVSVTTTVRSHA
jgi:hypothetical protein